MADPLGYRKFLTQEKGFKDEDVTYNNGSIFVKNRHFADATPQADGVTYGTREGMNKAFNAYTNAGFQDKAHNILGQVEQKINQAPTPFTYNRATDPLYQDAIKSASMNAQTAGNNAMVALGSRGIGNSSITSDRVAQIQQNELGKVERDIAPQLYNQAYKQYTDKYAMDQDQLKNQLGLAGTFNNMYKQGVDEQYKAEDRFYENQDRHITRAQNLENPYGVQVKPTDDYEQSLAQVDGLKPISQQNAERAAKQEEEKKAWALVESLGYVPPEVADILGIPAGTIPQSAKVQNASMAVAQQNATTAANKPISGSSAKPGSFKPDSNYYDDVAEIRKSPSIAVSTIEGNREALLDFYGPDGYAALLKEAQAIQKKYEDDEKYKAEH